MLHRIRQSAGKPADEDGDETRRGRNERTVLETCRDEQTAQSLSAETVFFHQIQTSKKENDQITERFSSPKEAIKASARQRDEGRGGT